MKEETGSRTDLTRTVSVLAMVNLGIWVISMIALIFVMQRSPGAKGLFPILGGGSAVAIALVSALSKSR